MPFMIRPSRRCLVPWTITHNAAPFLKLPPLTYFVCCWSLSTFLFLNHVPANAEWVALGDSDSGTTAYVETGTIHPNGDLVKVWELYDFKTLRTVEGGSYSSSRAQSENDCVNESRRTLSYTWFSGNMGSGKVVFSDAYEGRWVRVAPESLGQILWKFACSKP